MTDRYKTKGWLEDILGDLEYTDVCDMNTSDLRLIKRDLEDLVDYLCEIEEDEDEGPDPDEYHDRKKLEDYE